MNFSIQLIIADNCIQICDQSTDIWSTFSIGRYIFCVYLQHLSIQYLQFLNAIYRDLPLASSRLARRCESAAHGSRDHWPLVPIVRWEDGRWVPGRGEHASKHPELSWSRYQINQDLQQSDDMTSGCLGHEIISIDNTMSLYVFLMSSILPSLPHFTRTQNTALIRATIKIKISSISSSPFRLHPAGE